MGYKNPDYVRRADADALDFYNPSNLNIFNLKNSDGTNIYASGNLGTNKNLLVRANATDSVISQPYTWYRDSDNEHIINVGTGGTIKFSFNDTTIASMTYSTPDLVLTGLADKNIYICPSGTGKVKFGTHTGSGDVACNGSIAILDAAGNARKLMTTA
jgi:hypothetical protein